MTSGRFGKESGKSDGNEVGKQIVNSDGKEAGTEISTSDSTEDRKEIGKRDDKEAAPANLKAEKMKAELGEDEPPPWWI